jgi:hypothetical protein
MARDSQSAVESLQKLRVAMSLKQSVPHQHDSHTRSSQGLSDLTNDRIKPAPKKVGQHDLVDLVQSTLALFDDLNRSGFGGDFWPWKRGWKHAE